MRFSVYHPKWNVQQFPGKPHMLRVPRTVLVSFEDCLVANTVNIRGHYIKWLRFYLDFCSKYRHDANNSESIIAFQKKLLKKKQSERQRQQASHAIRLYLNVNQANTVSRSPSFLSISTVNNAENISALAEKIPGFYPKQTTRIAVGG
jgi:hypothetical protein